MPTIGRSVGPIAGRSPAPSTPPQALTSVEALEEAALKGRLPAALGEAYTRLAPAARASLDGCIANVRHQLGEHLASRGLPISSALTRHALGAALDRLVAAAAEAGLVAQPERQPEGVSRFAAAAQPPAGPALTVVSLPEPERIAARLGAIDFTEPGSAPNRVRLGSKAGHVPATPAEFYRAAASDPAFGFSPLRPRDGLTAAFVGKVLSRSDADRFARFAQELAVAFLAEQLRPDGAAPAFWGSPVFQGMLKELARRTGLEPSFGDLDFARLPAELAQASDVETLMTQLPKAALAGLYLSDSPSWEFGPGYRRRVRLGVEPGWSLEQKFAANHCD